MSIPNGIVKIKKDGVEFTSNVDRVNYTLRELTRAALRDVGRFICNRARKQIKRRTGQLLVELVLTDSSPVECVCQCTCDLSYLCGLIGCLD